MQFIHRIYGLVSARFRQRRLQQFLTALAPQPDTPILDVGGYPWFWSTALPSKKITLLNPHVIPGLAERYGETFAFVIGDGCKLFYPNQSFEIVFSNSVIEHLGNYENQRAFAAEARRVGKQLWIQTPAREFIFEPHLLTPLVHHFPKRIQRRLLRYFTVWGLLTRPTPAQVQGFLDEVRLLSHAEMVELFPDCQIRRETFLGFTKSYIAVRTAAPAAGQLR